MVRRLPPLNALRAFEAAGRHVSFSGAAEELNVTHAAISRHIRGLEKRLKVQLFRNVSRGVELTEAGSKFLRVISPAFDRIAEATEELSSAREESMTVNCVPTFAVKWLMPRLDKFNELHPDVVVKIDASERLADIGHYECDLAIRYFAGDAPGYEVDRICRAPVYPMGAPALRAARRGSSNPADLLNYRLLHEDKGELWRRWFAEAGLTSVEIGRLRTSGQLENFMAIEAAIAGQGLVLISECTRAINDLQRGGLERFSDVGLDYGGYYLVYLRETIRRKAVRAFRDWLLEATRDLREVG